MRLVKKEQLQKCLQFHASIDYLVEGLLKIDSQSHPQAYPFDRHQIIHHQVHHILLVVKKKAVPKEKSNGKLTAGVGNNCSCCPLFV